MDWRDEFNGSSVSEVFLRGNNHGTSSCSCGPDPARKGAR